MKFLIATTVLPDRLSTGGEIATMNFFNGLVSLGHDVEIFGYRRPNDTSVKDVRFIEVGRRYIETNSAGIFPYYWLLLSVFFSRPYIVQKFYSKSYERALSQRIASGGYDVLIVDHSQMGWVVDRLRLEIPCVFVAHNVESKLYFSQSLDKSNASWLKRLIFRRDSRLIAKLEDRLSRSCDQVWTLVESEKEHFAKAGGREKCFVMPLPGQGSNFSSNDSSESVEVGLIGTWAWDVNRAGLQWFFDEVVPLLPDSVRVTIAGRGAEEFAGRDSRVLIAGFVESAIAFMQSCKVLVVPTVLGAGVQLKTIEAISSGAAVVSTQLGVRGIESLPPHVAVADTPRDMVDEILLALGKTHHDRSQRGRVWAELRNGSFQTQLAKAVDKFRCHFKA